MKKALLFNLLIFCSVISFGQKDSLILFKMRVVSDTVIGGVNGVYFLLSSKLIYDSLFHGKRSPATSYLKLEVMKDGKPVKSTPTTGTYRVENNIAGYKYYHKPYDVNIGKIHIPYYSLDLPEGRYDIVVRITACLNDTASFSDKTYEVKIVGQNEIKTNINVPPKECFKVLVSGVRVMDTDFDGDQWDYNLISGSPPDPVWKIIASEGEKADYLYVSPITKNSYSAAWLDDSGELCVSKGDKFWIKVYDNDPLEDDIMSYIQVSVDELKLLSDGNKEMQIGRLTYFKINADKIIK